MPRERGWFGWVQDHPALTGGMALAVALSSAGIVAVANRSSSDHPRSSRASVPTAAATGHGRFPGVTVLPGVPRAPRCSPLPDREPGVTGNEITIGTIISDASITYSQFHPSYEGLQAYVKLVNDAGGVCGRKIKIDYSNDNLNPATHDYAAMIHKVFAFVASLSLFDQQDYAKEPPFNPLFQDNGEYTPDIGSLALSYPRAQSEWFGGPNGSVSPSLVSGSSFLKDDLAAARSTGHPCDKAGVLYLREPTGASETGARLTAASIAGDWGANLGAQNVKFYVSNFGDSVPVYEQLVTNMVSDGVHCIFSSASLQDNVNLVRALHNRGVWPPDTCSGSRCFGLVGTSYSGYDPGFIRNGGAGARGVQMLLPHAPLNEQNSNPALRIYLRALKAIPGAAPGTISILGFASGEMFVEALQACGGAPTRACVMDHVRKLKDFTAGGLVAGVTPFRRTRVDCSRGCLGFSGRGTYDFKWGTNCYVAVKVEERKGATDFYRLSPAKGYRCEDLHVGSGRPV